MELWCIHHRLQGNIAVSQKMLAQNLLTFLRNNAWNKSLEQWIQAPITCCKIIHLQCYFSVLNKLIFIFKREKMKMSFSVAQFATFIVQRQMERHADNTKNSVEKMTFNIKYIQLILMFSRTLPLEADFVFRPDWMETFDVSDKWNADKCWMILYRTSLSKTVVVTGHM